MAQRGYCQFSVLGRDREFSIMTEFLGLVSRQWVIVSRHVWSRLGEARTTGAQRAR